MEEEEEEEVRIELEVQGERGGPCAEVLSAKRPKKQA